MKKTVKLALLSLSAVLLLWGCTPAPPEESGSRPRSSVPSVSSQPPEEPSSSSPSQAPESPAPSLPEPSIESSALASEPPEDSQGSAASQSSSPAPLPPDTSVIYCLSQKPFVSGLSEELLYAFTEMYTAVTGCKTSVRFQTPVPTAELDRLMLLLNYECPELIHVTGDYSTVYADQQEETVSSVRFYYNMTPEEYPVNLRRTEDFLAGLRETLEGRSDSEKEQYVYDMIFSECVYDEKSANAGSVYGALIEHRARCEGISKAFMWCMRELGIECITVMGEPTWDTTALYTNHSWNLIRLGDNWYHVDLTADNLQNDEVRNNPPLYGFLNVDDSFVYQTRILSPYYQQMDVPPCTDNTQSYHRQHGLWIREDEDTKEGFYRILDSHFQPGEFNEFPIGLPSVSAYDAALDSWTDWLDEYQQENHPGSYSNTFFYNRVSRTVCVRSIYEASE